ncbi:MAG: sugar ABC transporter permease [Clostridia bacterium]|nr:sugar ABC transporter permease [Clostridia bacterium]
MTDGASAALQSAAGAESPKRVLSAQMGKAIIVIATVFICLLAALFGNVFAKIQPDLGYTINLSGLKLLSLLGQEGFNTVDLWQNSIFVPVPTLIPVVTLVLIALLVLLITLSVLRYTVGEKSGKSVIWSRALSIACFGVALFIAAVYVYMLFSKAKAYDYYGDERYLYNVFETKAVLLVYAVALLAAGAIEWKLSLKTVKTVKRFLPIYGFMVVPLILIVIFNFYPMLLQTMLSFKEFVLKDGVFGSDWVGLKQFSLIFGDPKMLKVIWQTLYISLLRLVVGIVPPLFLSVCLYDIKRQWLRSTFQSIVYIPHFFSWVVVYAITYSLLSPEGLVNNMLGTSTDFIANEKYFMWIVIITAVWKELGWGTILYLAALSGVDTALFEAAKIDGAGPLQRVWHITLPSIKNTIIFLTIMSLGNILKGAGGEQLLLFYTATTKEQALVIDTWLVWYGMNELQYSLGAAISFFQSAIGMVMVLVCNYVSEKTTGVGMW